jgi:hypothetical protein
MRGQQGLPVLRWCCGLQEADMQQEPGQEQDVVTNIAAHLFAGLLLLLTGQQCVCTLQDSFGT